MHLRESLIFPCDLRKSGRGCSASMRTAKTKSGSRARHRDPTHTAHAIQADPTDSIHVDLDRASDSIVAAWKLQLARLGLGDRSLDGFGVIGNTIPSGP